MAKEEKAREISNLLDKAEQILQDEESLQIFEENFNGLKERLVNFWNKGMDLGRSRPKMPKYVTQQNRCTSKL